MGEQGDVTIVWTEDEDDKMEAVIAKKMAEGMTFFIVEPRWFGLLPPKKTPLDKASDARKHRALAIKDEDFAAVLEAGSATAVKSSDKPVRTVKKAETPREAATGHSVGVKPMQGG